MKKLVFAVLMSASIHALAQDIETSNKKNVQFGISLGYIGAFAKSTVEIDQDNTSISSENSEGGISIGLSANIKLSQKFYLQPSAQYAFVDDETFLFVPVMLKYDVANGFNLMAGPQGSFSFGDKQGLPINTFGLDASFGAGYDFNEHFYLEARYAFELTNRTPDGIKESSLDGIDPLISTQTIDLKTKLNSIHVTIGYRF
ncbi:MAG: outer membrane beta-barrel protein [Aquaticitalea sp.]